MKRHNLGAQNLKLDLEQAFPETKFSVDSRGSNISVSWKDTPFEAGVEWILE